MKFLHFIVVVLLIAAFKGINGENSTKLPEIIVRTDIKGRLLTPEEGCGYSKVANTRIVGGSDAKVGAWPWIALLGSESAFGFEFECGGSLITSRHVLTAAHCNLPQIDTVRLGEHDLDDEDEIHQDIYIVWIRKHKEFNKYLMTDDIAMVYLERDVEFTDRISPICLPVTEEMRDRGFINTNPFVAGWGAISEKGPVSNILQQVQLPVVENSQCKKDYQRIGEFLKDIQFSSDRALCAGFREGGKDSCDGDSGGPLMLPIHRNGQFPFYQIGIISYGCECGRPNVPGVYVNVQYYSDWIDQSLNIKI